MSDEVETDLETLKEDWTPKQRENWRDHGKPTHDKLQSDLAREWYLRLYRPKKRGSGMMERDHVKTGTPEHYMKKFMEKLTSPWTSIHGLMMAQFGLSEDTMDKAERAAMEVVIARNSDNETALKKLVNEHEKVAELYGVEA